MDARGLRTSFSLAKEKAPSVIFLDEIDAIGAKRLDGSTSGDREVQRTLMQLLAELDGLDVSRCENYRRNQSPRHLG